MNSFKKTNNHLLIQQEREKANEYITTMELEKKGDLVLLTKDNAAKIEAMIRFNPRYGNTVDDNNPKCAKYYIKQLNENEKKYYNGEHIRKIIGYINSENSTRMSGNDMDKIKDAILKITKNGKDNLIEMLKNDKKEYELIDIITKEAKTQHANFSFATKFCHYMCFYLFEGTKYQDNYSIYDNNVIKTIAIYKKDKTAKRPYRKNDSTCNPPSTYYKEYQKDIDDILKDNGNTISRNAFDHILWYCLKIGESRRAKKKSHITSKGKKKTPFLSQSSAKRKKALSVIVMNNY